MTRAYRFHPLERRGIIVGLGAGQLLVLGVGVVAALLALRSSPGGGGVVAALLVLAGAGAAAVWPLAGRPATSWLPVVVRHVAGRRIRLGGPAGLGAPAGVVLRELPAGPGEEPIGVAHDRTAGTWAAVLPLAGRAFLLLDPDEQQRRLGAWRALLAAAGRPGSPVRRIQWVERTRPVDARPLQRHLLDAPVVSGLPTTVRASYEDLVRTTGSAGEAHEVLLVVAVRDQHSWHRGAGRPDGRRRPPVGAALRRELRLLQGQLRSSDVRTGAPLDRAGLSAALRAHDGAVVGPACAAAGSVAQGTEPVRTGGEAMAWPMASADGWGAARVDGRLVVTYWVAEWPRIEVGPDFLVPLLLAGGSRSVSLLMAPVPTARAIREVESARTADTADEELRRRAGFLPTARHRRQAEGAAEREAELAEGHVELRFSGYVTVSATSHDELAQQCAEIEQAAQQCHLELRRLWGQQREAATWTLPLGRGLR